MDIVRKDAGKRKAVRRLIVVSVILLLAAIAFGLSRLQPALPGIDAGTVWPDTVKRGPMLRQVHGSGSLVPEDVQWISAQTDGRVEKIYVQPGTLVQPDVVIMDLSNPALTEAMIGAEFDLKQADAAYTDLSVTLQTVKFDKQAAAAQIQTDYSQAKLKADRNRQLASFGLIPDLDFQLSISEARGLEYRSQIEGKRLEIIDQSAQAQLVAQHVRMEQLKAVYELKKQQVDQLHVRAGVTGMLQQLGNLSAPSTSGGAPPLQVGQNVAVGAILAKVAQQDRLIAQVRVTETDAKDVAIGQPAAIDTRNGIIAGKVIRIDPAAVSGTVTVDVSLTGRLPAGARPDLGIDGTIDIERLADVLYVARPTGGQANSSVRLFRYDPDGKTATRIAVKLGRASVNTIEILDGLNVGDKIILSDLSGMESHERIRLN